MGRSSIGGAAALPRHPRLVIAAICSATLLVVGLVAAINLAAPQLASDPLHPDATQLLWIVNAYVIAFACLVIPAGAVGDRAGRRRALVAGLLVVAAGTALSAAASSVPLLIAGRIVTGVGAALVLPNCLGVLVASVPEQRRSTAVATWATATGLGGLVGNIIGGALLTFASWRVLFLVVAAFAVAIGLCIRVTATPTPTRVRRLDLLGTALLTCTVASLLFGIIEGPELGWTAPAVLGALVGSVMLAVVWVLVELRAPEPLLDPRLLSIPAIGTACVGMTAVFFGSFGLFFLNASLFQYVRGFNVLQAGLATLPLAAPLLLLARLTPRLVARTGLTSVLAAAFAAIGIGLLGLSATTASPYPVYAIWMVVLGLGFALALPTITAELTGALPPARAGLAGGLQSFTRELGSALGVAVIGSVLTSAFRADLPPQARLSPSASVPSVLAASPRLHGQIVHAFADASSSALLLAAIVAAAVGALVVVRLAR